MNALATAHATSPTLKLLRCQLGRQAVALDAGAVHSIHRADALSPCPEAPEAAGRLRIHGADVVVFPLGALLGYAAAPLAPQQAILVLHTRLGLQGLLVDRVAQIAVPADQRLPMPAGAACDARFDAVIQREGEMLMLLSARRLFDDTPDAPPEPTAAALPRSPRSTTASRRRRGPQHLVVFTTAAPAEDCRPLAFGVSITQVAEIVESPALLSAPNSPEHVEGLVNWRGLAVRVIDLAGALGLPPGVGADRRRLLVLKAPGTGRHVGVLARPGIEMLRLPVPHIACRRPLPIDAERVHQIVELLQATLVLPDLSKLDAN